MSYSRSSLSFQSLSSMPNDIAADENKPLSNATDAAHRIVADFLRRHDYSATYASYRDEAAKSGWQDVHSDVVETGVQIEKLIELYEVMKANEQRSEDFRARQRIHRRTPLDLNLPGPSTLPYGVIQVFGSLHPSNILSLSVIQLPRRYFCTTRARFVRDERQVLCSTGADKNIVFSDAETGELVDMYEGGTGRGDEIKHGAAVLCTAQNPVEKREMVSCGMDSKVLVWDMLHGKPVQELRDHSRFVVRCAYSSKGQYLATCSYDRTIKIYKRDRADEALMSTVDEDEAPPPLSSRFHLVHTITTTANPESIVFVRSSLCADPLDPGEGELQTSEGLLTTGVQTTPSKVKMSERRRTWLAYTERNDSFLHYVALPLAADSNSEAGTKDLAGVTCNMDTLKLEEAAVDWSHLAFNTNESRSDLHVSYSLMYLTLHPLGDHIAIQTGDHSVPTTGYTPASSITSRILIMPLLSSRRLTTIWTGVTSGGFTTNRHAWLRDGSAAWLTSEDGTLRLVDMQSKIRATVHAHGAAASERPDQDSKHDELSRNASWSRGGNTVVKDVVVIDDQGTVASCGFDHTIRITATAT